MYGKPGPDADRNAEYGRVEPLSVAVVTSGLQPAFWGSPVSVGQSRRRPSSLGPAAIVLQPAITLIAGHPPE
jgi:hypothetical protein